MNWDSFSAIGYLGMVLGAAAVVSLLACWSLKRRALCRLGLGLSVAALACAMINSAAHVNRIEIDPSAKLAAAEALQEAKRQAVLDGRGEEVAQIRFAEDSGDEFLDKAGMDEADLKYMEKLTEPAVPEWKKEKKTRTSGGGEDTSVEGMIDDEERAGGAEVAALEGGRGSAPILMSEADVVMAHRIDRWNLRLSRYLVVFAVAMLALDYLRRFNIYREATRPVPLPSAWPNAVTPVPPVVERPDPPRRSVPEELAWLARRGDSFVYFTDDSQKADEAVSKLAPLKIRRRPLEVLKVDDADGRIDDDFVFEALWFGRGSFVVDSAERAGQMMNRFPALLKERRTTRARVRQTAHLVWDLESPMPESTREALTQHARATGLSLFICHGF